MSLFVVDIEATGPIPNQYAMIELGAVAIRPDESFDKFHMLIDPYVNSYYDRDAIAAIGTTKEAILQRPNTMTPNMAMPAFAHWIKCVNKSGRPVMLSDNIAFDWQWVNYYFHDILGENPFGYSGRRIGDLYCGLTQDFYGSWKHLRQTPHDHNALNDATANAEALVALKNIHGLKIRF